MSSLSCGRNAHFLHLDSTFSRNLRYFRYILLLIKRHLLFSGHFHRNAHFFNLCICFNWKTKTRKYNSLFPWKYWHIHSNQKRKERESSVPVGFSWNMNSKKTLALFDRYHRFLYWSLTWTLPCKEKWRMSTIVIIK